MCMMVAPILSLGIGAMQAMAQHSAQVQAANDQNAYYLQNAEAARRAAIAEYAHASHKIMQERAATTQDIMETRLAALQGRATARTAAGEAGVSGLSVDALIQDYYGREGRRADSLAHNYEMKRDNLRAEMDGIKARAEARINSVRTVRPPSFADAALRIGAHALQVFQPKGGTMNLATG